MMEGVLFSIFFVGCFQLKKSPSADLDNNDATATWDVVKETYSVGSIGSIRKEGGSS